MAGTLCAQDVLFTRNLLQELSNVDVWSEQIYLVPPIIILGFLTIDVQVDVDAWREQIRSRQSTYWVLGTILVFFCSTVGCYYSIIWSTGQATVVHHKYSVCYLF